MKYRKKPVEIEAFQMNAKNRSSQDNWPEWAKHAWQTPMEEAGSIFAIAGASFYVTSLEGTMHINQDDWVLRGIKGEIYPCKPDIFELTYEAISMTDTKEIEELKDYYKRVGNLIGECTMPERRNGSQRLTHSTGQIRIKDVKFIQENEKGEEIAVKNADGSVKIISAEKVWAYIDLLHSDLIKLEGATHDK